MGSGASLVPLLLAAAITPGPNNLVMLRIGLERGLRAVPGPATGVVLGGLGLLLASRAGVALAFAAHPWLPAVTRVCGAGCVAWLGVRLIRESFGGPRAQSPAAGAPGVLGMFLFQFINPKAWLVVLTIAAAGCGARPVSLASLVVLFVVIPYACLALWAGGGSFAAGLLREPQARAWLDRASGALLALSALLLLRP
jgi:threonine/homoserine/homoserine lactone efflux protein